MSNSNEELLATAHEPFESALLELSDHAPGSIPNTEAVHQSFRERLKSGLSSVAKKLSVREGLLVGNNVAIERGVNPKTRFESIPLTVRLGMHLLYCGREQEKLLGNKRVDELLREQSIRTGKKYDETGPIALAHIKDFIKTYSIDTAELLEQDLTKYSTFNDFFARRLKVGARPVASPNDTAVLTSAADSRLVVFENVDLAREFWIKGEQFTIAHLFDSEELAIPFAGCSIAIFRLAPADYHRSHSPIDGLVGTTKRIDGTYFTVNPCAIGENLDVFTRNRRDVTMLKATIPTGEYEFVFVAVGAMLVGSIFHSVEAGQKIQKGDELSGYKYGGSTSILLIPKAAKVKFDEDLLVNSRNGLETAVRVGDHIGTFV